jgi:hypothetical protein
LILRQGQRRFGTTFQYNIDSAKGVTRQGIDVIRLGLCSH